MSEVDEYNNLYMSEDLYRVDLESISGTELFRLIADFTRIDRPLGDRPREGYLLDFKEDLSDRFLRSVASFANTFGGLLIVGVSETDGRPDKLVGVSVSGELKTQVSSSIASNLFPCPPFEIAECPLPTEGAKKLCVVRVRETPEICLLAKKGESHPVYVRIEDQSSPADASKLRALLDRKSKGLTMRSGLESHSELIRNRLVVTKEVGGGRLNSETFFRVILLPHSHRLLSLDLETERKFFGFAADQTPGLQLLFEQNEVTREFQRGRDWSGFHFREHAHDYERRWYLSTNGEVGFVTQTRWPVTASEPRWSLYDIARDIACVVKLGKEFWRYTGYYGSFRLDAQLRIEGLNLLSETTGYPSLFYRRMGDLLSYSLDRTSVVLTDNSQVAAEAQADLSYNDLEGSLAGTVASVLNQLLRCLGHVADLQKLEQSVSSNFVSTELF